MNQPDRSYFQLEQAREVAEVLTSHEVDFLFIGKGAAIILGYPSATQDVDLFPKKSTANGRRLVAAVKQLGFAVDKKTASQIIEGVDFVQLKQGPFDLDLVFAPDGIASFEDADKRKIVVEGLPVAHIRDIIASKKASGREKDLVDLPLLEDFQDELERRMRRELKSSVEIAMERTVLDDRD